MRYITVLIISLLWLPTITLAAPRTFSELADLITNLINGGIGVALILGIVIYFYGVATNIPKMSEHGMEAVRAHFFWGILALFIMFSVWGILALLRNTLFSGGGYSVGGDRDGQVFCETLDDCKIQE